VAVAFEVREELWEVIEPLLPAVDSAATGRPRVLDRVAFDAIVFVLVTGIAWRRLRDWQQAGVWKRAHESLLERLNAAGAIDWAASVADGSHIRALQGGLDRAVSG
jgi:transposase